MIRRATFAALAILSAVGVSACNRGSGPKPDAPPEVEIPFSTDGSLDFLRDGKPLLTIDIEIADNDSSRMRGMMQRSSFPDKSGMLFIFPFERLQSFWMANTPIALDLLFVNSNKEIVYIHRYTKPLSPESVESDIPSQYVLELPAGFCDTYGIVESDRLTWTRHP